ncbi:MAG: hypothetical protein E7319_08730 [Clostridiales bacterium]|nr:hypothetical protein [Clostridiales bacterium]
MLTTLNRLVGLPVIWQGKQMGLVERGVPDTQANHLSGLVIRRGMRAAKWVPSQAVTMIGQQCVMVRGKPKRIPRDLPEPMKRVYLVDGQCVGEVTDAVVGADSLRVYALEISSGPLYRLMGQRMYAADYRVRQEKLHTGEVVAPRLLSWAEMERMLQEEDVP